MAHNSRRKEIIFMGKIRWIRACALLIMTAAIITACGRGNGNNMTTAPDTGSAGAGTTMERQTNGTNQSTNAPSQTAGEIVGNILDEYDKEEPDIVSRKNGTYELTGLTLLDDVEETLGVEFDKEDKDNFDTLNGFMVSRLGHIPKAGEKGSVRIGDYLLKIMKVENKVIQTVLAIPLPKEEKK